MKIGSKHIDISLVLVVAFYFSISDFFGLLDISLIVPGELYDYLFIISIIITVIFVIKKNGQISIYSNCVYLWPYMLLIFLSVVEMIILQIKNTQGIVVSLSVLRELLFIFIFFAFANMKVNIKKIVRSIIILDMISVFIYLIEMIHGGPIFNADLHSAGLYEPIAQFRLWRCWVDLPTFELFTIPYLLIGIVKHEKMFHSKEKDFFALGWIILGVILKLGRTELFSVIVCIILSYFYADKVTTGKIFKKIFYIFIVGLILTLLLYIIAGGIFERIINGVIAVVNIGNLQYSSTLLVRSNTLLKRINYLNSHGLILFGMGPLSRNYNIVLDATSIANRGILASDSAYATFLTRYGLIGTGFYILGHILNFFKLKKQNLHICVATGVMLISILVMGIGGYDNMGKQTLIKVGILFSLCIKERNNFRELTVKNEI